MDRTQDFACVPAFERHGPSQEDADYDHGAPHVHLLVEALLLENLRRDVEGAANGPRKQLIEFKPLLTEAGSGNKNEVFNIRTQSQQQRDAINRGSENQSALSKVRLLKSKNSATGLLHRAESVM